MRLRTLAVPLLLGVLLSSQTGQETHATNITPTQLPGLLANVRLVQDSDGIPHIYAENDRDVSFMLGFVHARDRFFQMDFFRRQASGTLAELTGEAALPSDIQFRTLGIRRAAEESWDIYSPRLRELLISYSDGVNAYLQNPAAGLPPEYAALEISEITPWTPIDSIAVAKGIAFSLSFDLDIDRTIALEAFQEAGEQQGFDGTALFFQDLYRSAPFDPSISIPGALVAQKKLPAQSNVPSIPRVRDILRPGTLQMARRFREKLRKIPALDRLARTDLAGAGSNWWLVSGSRTADGNPILANDPHLALDTPPIFYEAHLVVTNDPEWGPLNVNGVTFAGTPSVAQGCNEKICWGSTVNVMDVTDTFEEVLVIGLPSLRPTHTVFDGQTEALVAIPQTYRFNRRDNQVMDDLADAKVGPLEGGVTYLVPRRNMGPIVDIRIDFQVIGLSIQYAGARGTREAEAFYRWTRAENVEDFKEGLQYFDVGSQNWAYADTEGTIAYFTSGELPLREDLQAGEVDGLPPFLIRDGTHGFKNEWIPVTAPQSGQSLAYETLPFEEMPQVIDPSSGFVISANNDPLGLTLDNNPLNELRAQGGLLYLSPGYTSIRMGRISRLLDSLLAKGPATFEALQEMQADNQLLDAEVLVPYILAAHVNANQAGAPQPLAALGTDPAVTEAVNRLAVWNFRTPTGISEGYDPGDDPENLLPPAASEVDDSVAATIYAVWRGQFLRGVVGETLARLGLQEFQPDSERSMSAIRNLLDNFGSRQGIGLSGVDFFHTEEVSAAADARDLAILESLNSALERLAGEAFEAAFNRSTSQSDYRWGKLHRIVLDHPIGAPFGLPDGEKFEDLSVTLPGLARSGGYEVVDASNHSARADSLHSFMFGSGPARRFVGELDPEGIRGLQIIAGGQSGQPDSSHHSDQLGRWLTNQYHTMRIAADDVNFGAVSSERFGPTGYSLFFPFYRGNSGTFTGFAVSSLAGSGIDLGWTAFDNLGAELAFPENPRSMVLASSHQLALLGSDIFAVPPSDTQSGWVELTGKASGDVPLMGPAWSSFTQFGAFNLGRLDGGNAFSQPFQQLYFSRVFEGPDVFRGLPAQTFLSIANPDSQEAEISLTLRAGPNDDAASSANTPQASAILSADFTVPAKGLLFGSIAELFETQVVPSQAYIEARVAKGRGIVGFELILINDGKTLIGLNATPPNGLGELFSAQMAQTSQIFTNMNFINTSDHVRNLTLTAVDDDGTNLADPIVISLAAGAMRQVDVDEAFGFTQPVEGSLRAAVDGPGVIGDVIFGDPESGRFAAALALQGRPFSQAVFSQVGNTLDFFTGLAFFHPGSNVAEVEIQVFSAEGTLTGSDILQLPSGHRTAQLLEQIVPETEGQQGGYIVVQSSQPLVGQQLFGTFGLGLLSAVPPTFVE